MRNAGRVRDRDELIGMLTEIFANWDREPLLAALQKAGVPSGPINTIPQVFEEAQLKHRGVLVNMDHPLADKLPQVRNPIRLQNAPIAYDRVPPALGQHTAEHPARARPRRK